VITDVRSESPADNAGLATGTVITEAKRKPVNTPEDERAALHGKSSTNGLLLLVRDAHGARFVVVNPQDYATPPVIRQVGATAAGIF
jgi:S1-C subfamily serine protease